MAFTHSHHHDVEVVPVSTHVSNDGKEFGDDVHSGLPHAKSTPHTHEGVWEVVNPMTDQVMIVSSDPFLAVTAEEAAEIDDALSAVPDGATGEEAEKASDANRVGLQLAGGPENKEPRADSDVAKAVTGTPVK